MAQISLLNSDCLKPKISLENPLIKSVQLNQSSLISTKSSIPLMPTMLTKNNIQLSRADSIKSESFLKNKSNTIDKTISDKCQKYALSLDIKPKYLTHCEPQSKQLVNSTFGKSSETKIKLIKKKPAEKVSERFKRKSSKVDSIIPSKKIAKDDEIIENEQSYYAAETYKFSEGEVLDVETKMDCVFPDSDNVVENVVVDSEEIKHKKNLIDVTSSSLLLKCDFKDAKDEVRLQMYNLSCLISSTDPEFILKLALYSRLELNIRTTSNFLVALAAMLLPCRPYIAKYFNLAIVLPSDWIEVAEFYLGLSGEKFVSAALRRAMVKKFPDFDQYQLGKYNKEKSRKKKKVPTATLR